MYTENLPAEYRPADPESVPTIDPVEAVRMQRLLDKLGESDTLAIEPVRKEAGIGWGTLSRWLLHPSFKARWDRVLEAKKFLLDETVFQRALHPKYGHEDSKLWLKAHHPDYKESKQPQLAVQINIDSSSLLKSRAVHTKVTDTTSS